MFSAADVCVPQVHAHDRDRGYLLLDDLGERHFMGRLVDADLAQNNGGWQLFLGVGDYLLSRCVFSDTTAASALITGTINTDSINAAAEALAE